MFKTASPQHEANGNKAGYFMFARYRIGHFRDLLEIKLITSIDCLGPRDTDPGPVSVGNEDSFIYIFELLATQLLQIIRKFECNQR
jgi:hypothetical protein